MAAGALLCLLGLLDAGSLLPLAARTTIDSTLLLLAMSLASSTSPSSLTLPAAIRLPLYRCLVAALVHPPAASPSSFTSPLLPYALPVLRRGATTGDGDEAGVCRDGLLLCEWLTRERAGVASGRRRKADRVFDRKEGDDDEAQEHMLDRLDEWNGSAAGAAGGGRKRRAEEVEEREGGSAAFGGRGGVVEQKESVQRMEEADDEIEEDESRQAAVQQPEEEQQLQAAETEHKQLMGYETAEHSEEEEEGMEEQDEQSEDDQQQLAGDEDVEEQKQQDRQAEFADRAEHPPSKPSSSGDANPDDEEFGAVLHVDDEDDLLES